MRRNVRVLNGQYLVAVFALDPFGGDGGGGDGGSTSKGFEFGILDDAVGVHFDLKLVCIGRWVVGQLVSRARERDTYLSRTCHEMGTYLHYIATGRCSNESLRNKRRFRS